MLEAIRQLLPVLAGLYLLEGVTWVRRGRLGYLVGFLGGARRLRPGLHSTGVLPARGVFAPRAADTPPAPPEAFDLEGLRERFERWQAWSQPTSELASMYLMWVFGGFSLVVLYASPPPIPAVFVGAALLLHGATATLAHRLARRLRREGLPPPSTALVGIWIYPPATMRAVAELSRELLTDFDDSTLAAAFLDRETVRRLARRRLAMAEALPQGEGKEKLLHAFHELLRQVGLSPESILEAPVRRDATARAYCPACTEEYVKIDILCEDCGVPVEAYGHG